MSNSFPDRREELEAFKREIDLTVVASACGFVVDPKETTRGFWTMRRGDEKIGISRKNGVWLYCMNMAGRNGEGGNVIDFVQNIMEPHSRLGRVRQVLRPYLNSSAVDSIRQKTFDKFRLPPLESRPAAVDYLGIASRVSQFVRVVGHNDYLCNERAIPASVLEHPRVAGRVRLSTKHGSLIFPHYGTPNDNPKSEDRCLNGYEIKGRGVNFFSKGGRKGLWTSAGFDGDRILAVSESGVDALSYLALNNIDETRIVSIGGNFNSFQPELLKSAIGKMEEGAVVVSCVDNDPGGDKLTETIAKIVSECGRADIDFREHRPATRGEDWNAVLKAERGAKQQNARKLSL